MRKAGTECRPWSSSIATGLIRLAAQEGGDLELIVVALAWCRRHATVLVEWLTLRR